MWWPSVLFFFFNDTATTEIYTLSLHDALPIFGQLVQQPHVLAAPLLGERGHGDADDLPVVGGVEAQVGLADRLDRKSTRLNSSHANISYAVFCLKKKKLN